MDPRRFAGPWNGSPFSTAFKRVMGAPPRQYGRRPASAANDGTARLDGAGQARQ